MIPGSGAASAFAAPISEPGPPPFTGVVDHAFDPGSWGGGSGNTNTIWSTGGFPVGTLTNLKVNAWGDGGATSTFDIWVFTDAGLVVSEHTGISTTRIAELSDNFYTDFAYEAAGISIDIPNGGGILLRSGGGMMGRGDTVGGGYFGAYVSEGPPPSVSDTISFPTSDDLISAIYTFG